MPIRIACPDCSARLSAPDEAAGTVVKCPKCRAPMEVPDVVEIADRPRSRCPARDDDEDGRPRRRQHAARGGFPAWAAVLLGLALAGAAGAGVYLVARGKGQPKDDPAAGGGGGLGGLLGGRGGSGVKYVPGESETKFRAALDRRERDGAGRMTEAEVFAVLGEPTRRGETDAVTRGGRTFVIYDAYWHVPDSGAGTRVTFTNGVVSGMQIAGGRSNPDGPKDPDDE